MTRAAEEDDIFSLETFFLNDDYQLTTFTFGSEVLELLCLNSASTDFDLTGQLVWPGAVLLNKYISKNSEILQGHSIIELGSGVGITGILCSRFCREIVLTDHNDEVLKILQKNIALHGSPENSTCGGLSAEKLDWGNSDQLNHILQAHVGGVDLVLGADICFQQSSIPLLFDTVEQILRVREKGHCKFILAYVSRVKVMDSMVITEAKNHGLQINEIVGTRSMIGILEGVIYEITL
jgi:predicted nicotinamide N-methyase